MLNNYLQTTFLNVLLLLVKMYLNYKLLIIISKKKSLTTTKNIKLQ